LILDMDADRVQYPRDFVREAGRRNLRRNGAMRKCTNERVSESASERIGG